MPSASTPPSPYVSEKLLIAIVTLVGPGSLQTRLHGAYANALCRLTRDDFRPWVQQGLTERFAALELALTRGTPTAGEGRVTATIRDMSDATAAALAEEIVGLFEIVSRGLWT